MSCTVAAAAGGGLAAQCTDDPRPAALTRAGRDEFWFPDGRDRRVRFLRGPDGAVTGLTWEWGDLPWSRLERQRP